MVITTTKNREGHDYKQRKKCARYQPLLFRIFAEVTSLNIVFLYCFYRIFSNLPFLHIYFINQGRIGWVCDDKFKRISRQATAVITKWGQIVSHP